MEDELENYPHLYEFLPDNFRKRAKEKERDVKHPVLVSLNNNSSYLQTLNDKIKDLKEASGEDILARWSEQADSNKKFHSFVAEMNCYLLLKDVFEDLEPVDEDSVPEEKKPTDFHSENHNIDIEATYIGKHEPENKLYSIIREWVDSFEQSYQVRLIKKDNYNKFASGYQEIDSNASEVEEVKRLIQEAEEPETIETNAFKVEVKKTDREESIFTGGGWESAESIPLDPTGSLEDRIKEKTEKEPISDHLIIYLDIDGLFMASHSLTKILQGSITHFDPPIEPEISQELNTDSKELKNYMKEYGMIPSDESPSAIPPDEEGIFHNMDDSVIEVIAYLPNRSLLVYPNIYSRNDKVGEVLSIL